ncbi:substrate-binding domain-containing protein [Streptomyces sp. NPDC050145]|uniref:substrate-binding domain-containing protein n=1 Tax=Streptomyces sp. NPDC050145 TaxID=3365602 RepID=UPI0037982FBF
MTVSAQARRTRILEALRGTGAVRVVDLADRLGIPAVTLRRDVAALADEGRLSRTHGSVELLTDDRAEPGRDRVIGMLVPTVGQYFDEVVAGARAAAAAAGARLVLGIAPYGADSDRVQVQRLLESEVDGLLLAPDWHPGRAGRDTEWLGELPVPAVLVERRAEFGSPAAELDAVCSHHRHGVLLALRHLAGLGHRAVLLAARDDTYTARDVRRGYQEAVDLLGLDVLPVTDVPGPGDPAALATRLAEAAASGVRAALVHNDQDALQLPALLRTHGLGVPADLALVAYDDVYAALADPPLTAVAPPKRAVGAEALHLLLRRLTDGDTLPTQQTELLPTLKIRQSCGQRVPG